MSCGWSRGREGHVPGSVCDEQTRHDLQLPICGQQVRKILSLLSFTGIYWDLLGFTGFYTCTYMVHINMCTYMVIPCYVCDSAVFFYILVLCIFYY